jgi:hypothetical protein
MFGKIQRQTVSDLETKLLNQIKVAIKQEFDNVDAIIFEAALTLNEIETKYKQKAYIS